MQVSMKLHCLVFIFTKLQKNIFFVQKKVTSNYSVCTKLFVRVFCLYKNIRTTLYFFVEFFCLCKIICIRLFCFYIFLYKIVRTTYFTLNKSFVQIRFFNMNMNRPEKNGRKTNMNRKFKDEVLFLDGHKKTQQKYLIFFVQFKWEK